jgi:hypothetical protein
MFSTDRYSAERRIQDYKNVAVNNAQLSSKRKAPMKKSLISRLVSAVSL